MYLLGKASRARVREAENARRNRAEILKAWSQGQVSRRDLIKMGVFTAGGALALKNGLSPFAPSAYGSVPTGFPRSPLFNVQAFTQAMPRFDVLPRNPVSALNPTLGWRGCGLATRVPMRAVRLGRSGLTRHSPRFPPRSPSR